MPRLDKDQANNSLHLTLALLGQVSSDVAAVEQFISVTKTLGYLTCLRKSKGVKIQRGKSKGVRSLILLLKLILFYQETRHDLYQ